MLRLCSSAGVTQVLQLGSLVAYGNERDDGAISKLREVGLPLCVRFL